MRFDYGDEVIAKIKEGTGNVIEKVCYVVSITPVETEQQATEFNRPKGDVLYTVEFVDGTDALVAEADLRPA
jgi:hypothetical protein